MVEKQKFKPKSSPNNQERIGSRTEVTEEGKQKKGGALLRLTSFTIERDMKKLLLSMLFLLLCACASSSTKPTASVTGSEEPDAAKEDQRHAIDGLGPR